MESCALAATGYHAMRRRILRLLPSFHQLTSLTSTHWTGCAPRVGIAMRIILVGRMVYATRLVDPLMCMCMDDCNSGSSCGVLIRCWHLCAVLVTTIVRSRAQHSSMVNAVDTPTRAFLKPLDWVQFLKLALGHCLNPALAKFETQYYNILYLTKGTRQ